MTGIRLWMDAISSFGEVVMMVADLTSDPSGDCQRSHNPARAKGFPDFSRMKCGILLLLPGWACHSKKPSAKIRQRRYLYAERKEGFSASVSARALIIREPMDGSLAQEGISPQTKKSALSEPSLGRTSTGWVGAMLKRGAPCAGKVNSGKASRSSAGFVG